jgi:hypothetical protein
VRRFGLLGHDSSTLEEVGQEIGLTRERVRQIQVEALKRLRRVLERQGLSATRCCSSRFCALSGPRSRAPNQRVGRSALQQRQLAGLAGPLLRRPAWRLSSP